MSLKKFNSRQAFLVVSVSELCSVDRTFPPPAHPGRNMSNWLLVATPNPLPAHPGETAGMSAIFCSRWDSCFVTPMADNPMVPSWDHSGFPEPLTFAASHSPRPGDRLWEKGAQIAKSVASFRGVNDATNWLEMSRNTGRIRRDSHSPRPGDRRASGRLPHG